MWPCFLLFASSPESGELLVIGCGVVAVAWGIGASAAYGAAIPIERRAAVRRVQAVVKARRSTGDAYAELGGLLFDIGGMLRDCHGELTVEQLDRLAGRLDNATRATQAAHELLAGYTIAVVESWVAGDGRQKGGADVAQ